MRSAFGQMRRLAKRAQQFHRINSGMIRLRVTRDGVSAVSMVRVTVSVSGRPSTPLMPGEMTDKYQQNS